MSFVCDTSLTLKAGFSHLFLIAGQQHGESQQILEGKPEEDCTAETTEQGAVCERCNVCTCHRAFVLFVILSHIIVCWSSCKGSQQQLLRELPKSPDGRREKRLRKPRKPKKKVPQVLRGWRFSSPDRNQHIGNYWHISSYLIFYSIFWYFLTPSKPLNHICTLYIIFCKHLQKLLCEVKKATRKARALRSGLSTLDSAWLRCALSKQGSRRVLLVCSVPLHHRLIIAGILVLQHPI